MNSHNVLNNKNPIVNRYRYPRNIFFLRPRPTYLFIFLGLRLVYRSLISL